MNTDPRRFVLESLTHRYRAIVALSYSVEASTPNYYPPAVRQILCFVRNAASFCLDHIHSLTEDPALDSDPELDFQNGIKALCDNHERLADLLRCVRPADVGEVPFELADALKRVVQTLFGESSDLLLTANAGANYYIDDIIAHYVQPFVHELGAVGFVPPNLPAKLFLLELPSAEYDQVLLHCVLAHELGHSIWSEDEISAAANVTETSPEILALAPELRRRVLSMCKGWLLESFCDLFAIYLLGPAYVSASIYYALAITPADVATPSHPPYRSRLQWMLSLLDAIYCDPKDDSRFLYGANTAAFLLPWRLFAAQTYTGIVQDVMPSQALNVAHIVFQPERYRGLQEMAKQAAASYPNGIYTSDEYCDDLRLTRYIDAHVPPVQLYEIAGSNIATIGTFRAIMTAAWESFLGEMIPFGSRLRPEQRQQDALVRLFNGFILKSIELAEIAQRWPAQGVSDDTVLGSDPNEDTKPSAVS